jgi:CBS domain-containing protein
MRGMKVRQVMTTPAVTVRPETSFPEIVAKLLDNDISGMPVVDDEDRLVGVVSEADLVGRQVFGYRRRMLHVLADHLHGRDTIRIRKVGGLTAADLMTPRPDAVGPGDHLVDAARRMLEGGHKRLPVVDDGRVVGVVARHDFLRPFARSDADIADDVRRLLADPFRIDEDHGIQPSVAAGVVTLCGTVRRATDVEIVEHEVERIAGVVAVDNQLHPLDREPLVPPLRRW